MMILQSFYKTSHYLQNNCSIEMIKLDPVRSFLKTNLKIKYYINEVEIILQLEQLLLSWPIKNGNSYQSMGIQPCLTDQKKDIHVELFSSALSEFKNETIIASNGETFFF